MSKGLFRVGIMNNTLSYFCEKNIKNLTKTFSVLKYINSLSDKKKSFNCLNYYPKIKNMYLQNITEAALQLLLEFYH